MQSININGPVNVVRLEGNINDISKVIYVMFDFHNNVNNQTKCNDIRSYDVSRFLVKTFDELKQDSKKIYDFMFEQGPNPLYGISKYKDRYIDEIGYMFNKAFNVDKEKNIVSMSHEMSNVRFHWVDIREFMLDYTKDMVYRNIPMAIEHINQNFSIQNINNLYDALKITNAQMTYLYNLIYKDTDITKQEFTIETNILADYLPEEYRTMIKNMIKKLFGSYKNDNVKEKIINIINVDLHNVFTEYFKFIDDVFLKLDNLKHKFTEWNNDPFNILIKHSDGIYNYGPPRKEYDETIAFINSIKEEIINVIIAKIGLYMMDIYLIRRFLDKNYITNTVSYTGALHSVNYIRILVKYFDFKITHYSYLKDGDINNVHKIIKQSKVMDNLNELFYPPTFLQCSNLNNFPKLFD